MGTVLDTTAKIYIHSKMYLQYIAVKFIIPHYFVKLRCFTVFCYDILLKYMYLPVHLTTGHVCTNLTPTTKKQKTESNMYSQCTTSIYSDVSAIQNSINECGRVFSYITVFYSIMLYPFSI